MGSTPSQQFASIALRDPDVAKTAHQYIDWLIEGEDIVLVSRTAFECFSFQESDWESRLDCTGWWVWKCLRQR